MKSLKNSSAGDGDPAFASENIYNSLGYNPFNIPNDQVVGTDGGLNPNAQVIYNSLDWYDVYPGYYSHTMQVIGKEKIFIP